jgi:hypothetical protein
MNKLQNQAMNVLQVAGKFGLILIAEAYLAVV